MDIDTYAQARNDFATCAFRPIRTPPTRTATRPSCWRRITDTKVPAQKPVTRHVIPRITANPARGITLARYRGMPRATFTQISIAGCARLLLRAHADADAASSCGLTPLRAALDQARETLPHTHG
eukprot:3115136-Pleurochrysis_carterae.AAC.1